MPLNISLKDAGEDLEKGTLKIDLVIADNNFLKGTICDGDIRRAILKELDSSYSSHEAMIANYLSRRSTQMLNFY